MLKKKKRKKIIQSFQIILNMTSNRKKFRDISYSLRIDSSIYHVLGRRVKNSKFTNAYSLAEDATIRSKSAKGSSPNQHFKTRKRSISPIRRPNTNHYPNVNAVTHLISNQQQLQGYTDSQSKKAEQTFDTTMKIERKALIDSFRREIIKERKGFVEATINNQKQELIRLFNEQKHSLTRLLEQQLTPSTTVLSTDLIKQIVTETLKSQQQEVQKTLSKNANIPQPNPLDTNTMNRFQDTLTQIIEKYIASIEKVDSVTLTRLFVEQKQALVETLSQQILPLDLIKQIITDAFNEHKSISIPPNIPNHRKIINHEVQITADPKHTRIDAAFRQQRDSIVANRYLRDTVRKWSNVRSISSLVKKIQACGTNQLENAWLLYSWIGQNIRYDLYCQNNSAESVFQNRTGISQGFVSLFHECCTLLSIQCSEISGYIKQNFLKQNEDLNKCSHTWNAIVLDQYTYLVDPTWGAGGRDNINEFEHFYFLTSAEELIYTHYSNGYQLLKPEITEEEFVSLPVMKSNYYRLNLNLLSPKQGVNQTNENIFKISIKTPGYVDLSISLKIDKIEYPRHLHTLCQRDRNQIDTMNCFLAPPTDGLYDLIIYAKTNDETTFRDTIYMRLYVSNIVQSFTFPIIYQLFNEYQCILIEPFRRLVRENECVFIHMKIPGANVVKIQNGEDYIVPNKDEYKNGVLKKQVNVQGDIRICAQWDDKADTISTICVFNMI
jgi:hypothetical protein